MSYLKETALKAAALITAVLAISTASVLAALAYNIVCKIIAT